ncbi:hypothetical protein I4U23_017797 [Adineta vaga]|nr:hypothetical protein I4U23_017797 [Adineta vaga]
MGFNEDTRQLNIGLFPNNSVVFIYDIRYGCNNRDHCAQDFAANMTMIMKERQYHTEEFMLRLSSFISSSLKTSNDSSIACYDSNDHEYQCSTAEKRGFCSISHEIFQNRTDRSCRNTKMTKQKVSVNQIELKTFVATQDFVSIKQSSRSADFTVFCNPTLCNTNATLQTVKNFMFNNRITETIDGKLIDIEPEIINNSGGKMTTSILIMIMMIFRVFIFD